MKSSAQPQAAAKRSGVLLIDKPGGLTSHDVVSKVRRAAGTRKVGHAGTLDPMATGLLVLGLNSSTRLLTFVVGLDKEYEATIRLGAATTTDDAEGEILPRAGAQAAVLDPAESPSPAASVDELTAADIDAALAAQTGAILQRPSSVSAIKVDGKRAYARVREGETVRLDARPVTIASIELLDSRPALDASGEHMLDLDVRVVCSSGTYIRAIARDVGENLGVGGHLTALRRTRVGPFRVTEAHGLDGLDAATALVPPARVAEALFAIAELGDEASADLRNGKKIAFDGPAHTTFAAVEPRGELIGLFEVRGGVARVLVNFPPDENVPAAEGRDGAGVAHDPSARVTAALVSSSFATPALVAPALATDSAADDSATPARATDSATPARAIDDSAIGSQGSAT